jgi:hypothetical protein
MLRKRLLWTTQCLLFCLAGITATITATAGTLQENATMMLTVKQPIEAGTV